MWRRIPLALVFVLLPSGGHGASRAFAQQPSLPDRPAATPVVQHRSDELFIDADTGSRQGTKWIYEGYVDIRFGTMRLQCDRLVFDEETNQVEALGNVVYDQEGQRITATRAWFDLRTRKGSLWNALGYTDRTPDGVTVFFEADLVERTGLSSYEIRDGRLTSCEESIPKWSFSAGKVALTLNERVSLRSPTLRVKNVPVFWLPYATVPIARRTRQSGLLTPSLGNSNVRGRSLTVPYYQVLGRSADVISRFDLYTERGVGFGADFRAKTGETSQMNTGFFAVLDRLFGQEGPKQGGTAFYLDAVQYLPEGFLLAADVNITSNLTFRQIFSDSLEQAISPEERTQVYVNNNFGAYSFNLLAESRDIFLGGNQPPDPDGGVILPDQLVTTRHLPSFELSRRSTRLTKSVPLYLSFRAAAEGLSRGEAAFETPSVVQRLDFYPRLTLSLPSFFGIDVTPTAAFRSTFYSDSQHSSGVTPIVSDDIIRTYVDVSVDIRPPAMERVFHHLDGSRWFKHVIEPSVTYRRTAGINSDFSRIIRFDEHDTVAETNEIEYSLTNRFFIAREGPDGTAKQPHEWLTVTLAQQYFFDPTFGGALRQGQRNQFDPITRLTGFSFGGIPRRFSPLNFKVRVRPLSSLFADLRINYGTKEKSIRNISLTGGMRTSLLSFYQTWYMNRKFDFDRGSFPGNLYQTSVFLGNRQRGPFVGFDLIYDFTNRVVDGVPTSRRVVSSTVGIGYAFDCCSIQVQNTTYKIGLRNENRLAFSFGLLGIGSFGRDTNAGRRIFDMMGGLGTGR